MLYSTANLMKEERGQLYESWPQHKMVKVITYIDEMKTKLGLPAAIIFVHLCYWIYFNAKNGNNVDADGTVWTYQSYADIHTYVECLSVNQIKVAIQKLIEADLIKKACKNKIKYDRTSWYALTAKGKMIAEKNELNVRFNCNKDVVDANEATSDNKTETAKYEEETDDDIDCFI